MLRSQILKERRCRRKVSRSRTRRIILQNATSGMAEQAEELRRSKEAAGVHIDAWDWDQLRGVRHAVVISITRPTVGEAVFRA